MLFRSLLLWWLLPAAAFAGDGPVREMTLGDAVAAFRAEGPTVAQLRARVAEARAAARMQLAPALPVVVAQGGYVHNNAEVVLDVGGLFDQLADSLPLPIDTSGLPGATVIQPLNQWTGGVNVQVPLVAAAPWLDHAAARAQAEAAARQAEAAQISAELALVRLAWAQGAAEASADAARHAIEVATAHRDRAARRVEAGLGTPLEVLVADAEVARREMVRVGAELDVDRARRAAGALLGRDEAVDIATGPPVMGAAAPSAERPEQLAADAALTAADRSVTAAWLRHAPTLSANFQASASDVPFPTGLTHAWRVGATLTWVMYDGGARYGLIDVARARRDGAEAAAAALDADTAREQADASLAVVSAQARLRFARAALEAAEAAEAAAARGDEAGLVPPADVLDAQQRRYDAAVAFAGAEASLGVAIAERDRAVGAWSP